MAYEEEHDLHREFFRIANIESEKQRRQELEQLIDSPYGVKILGWLRKHYTSELSHKT